MKLFGFLQKEAEQNTDEKRPPLTQQIAVFIQETRLKIAKKDRAFRVKAIIILVICLYFTGFMASVFRHFGEIAHVGYREAPGVTVTPWGVVAALFDFRYSYKAILLTIAIVLAILLWYIRNKIGLGRYKLEERGGQKFKSQIIDATLGSGREMTEEEIVDYFNVIPSVDFHGNKNPGTIIFGREIESGDFITEDKSQIKNVMNRNTIVIGSSGCFKTGSFIIPMIMQLARSGENMIINDPSTEISKSTYHLLKKRGYEVKIFNIEDPSVSDGWNFVGVVGENHTLSKSFARMIIDSFAGKGVGDPFWPEGMYVLLSALILYVNSTPNNTIEQIRYMLNDMDLEDYDAIFDSLEENHPARMEYNTFKTSPVKMNVRSGAAQRLAVFNSSEISRVCSSEGIDIINDLAMPDKKTAIFIVASDVESAFSFIPSLFLTAAAVLLSNYAKRNTDNLVLPRPVHFIMDEFSNTAYVEDIGRYLSTTRKYGLVFHLIVQSFPQFYKRYDENMVGEIVSNCEHTLCFGAGEPETAEFFEKYCGPTTVRTSMTSSGSVVTKTTDQFREGEQQRMLYFANEILTMKKTEYLLLTIGQHPLKLRKVYWKTLEDSKLSDDFIMRTYKPQCIEYKATSRISTTVPSERGKDASPKSSVQYSGEYSAPVDKQNSRTQSFRGDESARHKPADRKPRGSRKNDIPKSFDETPPFYQRDFYKDRQPANTSEVFKDVNKDGVNIMLFRNNPKSDGTARQAVILRYNIDGTTCKIEGTVPDNLYVAVKTKIDLNTLERTCKISKENSVLMGWKLLYKKDGKEIESKRLKDGNSGRYVDETGAFVKSYSFFFPQSDCELSPVFETAKGADRNEKIAESQPQQQMYSAEQTTMKL